MSRMQIPYEFFFAGLAADAANLTPLGITKFYPGHAPDRAQYGFIAFHPPSGQSPTITNDDFIVFRGGLFDLEIVLGRDANILALGPIEARMMTLFHGQKFVRTTSGVVESCKWQDTFDLPYNMVDGTYPRRILRFEVVT